MLGIKYKKSYSHYDASVHRHKDMVFFQHCIRMQRTTKLEKPCDKFVTGPMV